MATDKDGLESGAGDSFYLDFQCKVDQKTNREARRCEAIDALSVVAHINRPAGLKFDEDGLFNDQVCFVLANDDVFVPDFQFDFRLDSQSCLLKLVTHGIVVTQLGEAGAELAANFK